MQILELSTGGHKVESMEWNGETLYKQRLPFDTYVYTANANTPFDFSTYDFLDFSHLNPDLIVASGDVDATYSERRKYDSDHDMYWERELYHHYYGKLPPGKKISSYLPYLKVTLPPGEKLKVTFRFQAAQGFGTNESYWYYYLFNSEHLIVNEGMNKLVKYDGYNSSTPDCITGQFSNTGSLYQEYLNAGIINAYSFGSSGSLYTLDGYSMIVENTGDTNKDFYFYFGFSGYRTLGSSSYSYKAFATGEITFERMV